MFEYVLHLENRTKYNLKFTILVTYKYSSSIFSASNRSIEKEDITKVESIRIVVEED